MMRPFRFRLETVRRLRDHAERQARDELARELSVQSALEDEVRRSRSELAAAAAGAGEADIRTRASWQAFIERREQERSSIESELTLQAERVAETRTVLGQASREHKAISKLETKHRERHQDEVRRRQEAELGDVVLHAYRRAEAGAA